MKCTHATIYTGFAKRYLQSICSNWGDHCEIVLSANRASVSFGDGKVIELLSSDASLRIWVLDEYEHRLASFTEEVTGYIRSVSSKEKLEIEWSEMEVDLSFDKSLYT